MAFGFLMCFSMFRFMYYGWIDDAYLTPTFHFTYQFFDWVSPLGETGMYVVVTTAAISAFLIGIGLLYRLSAFIFFLSFTYLELLEKSWYLNHYYFVSLVAFLLILVPANRAFSLDAKLRPNLKATMVSNWTILIIKLQLCCVYFFGGVAKIKSDWLFEAQPLKIWLRARTDLPLLGWLFDYDITPYIFSWTGMFYDLLIPFLLWNRKSRPIAYLLVLFFHIVTYALFNIGMFPWLMIFGSLIFISVDEWQRIISFLNIKFGSTSLKTHVSKNRLVLPFFICFIGFQFLFPFRHHLYSNNVLWTESGLRFSWHVMIMEKNGYTEFKVIDNETGDSWTEYPSKRLSVIQEKQMSFQPDMIWQYGNYLNKIYSDKGIADLSVYVYSKVSINGRTSQTFINPEIDITDLKKVDDIYQHVLPQKK